MINIDINTLTDVLSKMFDNRIIRVDIFHITDHCVRELILVLFGYRLVEWYKFAKSPDEKTLQLNTLQKIFEMD